MTYSISQGFCFAVLCCGYTLTDFPIIIRLTLLALWQSNDCPTASKATLMNMDKYFMWIHYERLHNHNKAKHNKTVCIFLGIYCMYHDTKHTVEDLAQPPVPQLIHHAATFFGGQIVTNLSVACIKLKGDALYAARSPLEVSWAFMFLNG